MRWGWLALGLVGCTSVHRAMTYPRDRDITSVDWYKPMSPIKGVPSQEFPRGTAKRLSPESLAAAQAYAEEKRSSAFLVVEDGVLVHEWYAKDFSASHTTNSMSMAKTILGLMVGIAVADGKVKSVDDFVSTYLPEFQGDGREKVRIRHLLEMRSGLRNREELKLGSDLVTYLVGTHIERHALRVPLEKEPGTTFNYNNANSILLAMVLENVYGQSYESLISERLWKPIGAGDASFWLDRKAGLPRTFCCLFATPTDWAHVGELIRNQGEVGGNQVVSRDWIWQMSQPSGQNEDYGWHIWRTHHPGGWIWSAPSESYLDPKMVFLYGFGEQKVYILPTSGLVIVRVGEQPSEWDDAVLPNTLVRGLSR